MKNFFPHLFVFFAFLTLVYLGTWQLQRREEKQTMLNKIDANINAKPINPEEYKNLEQDEFRKMTVTGNYQYEKEFLLLNKSFNNKAGQHVITPIKTTNGEIILVDRGWISTDHDYQKPQGQVTITAIIRATQKLTPIVKALSLIENNPQKQTWMWLDLPTIYKNINAPVKDYYLDLVNQPTTETSHNGPITTTYPVALPAKIDVYNEHLIYVITWYSLSIALLAVYYFRFWKNASPNPSLRT